MATQKKFGAFAGVFTPSILTILGVIMYMRMGWVVGNAGLVGTLVIIVIAHVISVATGLSLSSIATDKKVGAGGIYYILSRSMGIPIGGAIGITLYIGTAFSIALYLIGFAESFNGFYGFSTDINGLRIAGSVALLALTAIALISTSFALKTQFFILAAIVVSLVAIFFGTSELAPESVNLFANNKAVPIEVVFAIFFPAVTGFTAGVAMSGDLKDPKKSLPIGTIAAISIGFIVYIGLAIFLANYVDAETLRTDYNILMKIALYAPAVVAGIWGATLSSALGGILGGPRILQAMSIDKITPKIFGKGKGASKEPVNALILVFVIAQAGILIGELDVIARVVSMFYLAAYGFINLAFFLESWANPDFQPTFKVNRWFGLIGFLASFAIMFKLDSLAMFGAIVIIIGIFFWLQRKQIQLDSGDVWHSVWENVVAKGLKRIDAKDNETNTNWNPNIILFSGESKHRQYLLELANTISGRTGIVTNFKLILDKNNDNPLTKTEQIVKDPNFEKMGVYGRQVKVDNIYRGIENIASTFGFSGVEPNTIMMGWPKELRNSRDYAVMTQQLIHLDYNLLYLDFDLKAKFGKYETVDLWWRETDNKNAEMMLNIVRFIIQSSKWNKAKIRVLFVNHNNIENNIVKSKIEKLVEKLRVNVEIKVINNGVEQMAFYDIITLQSATTDLTILGIPDIKTEKQADFVLNTNQLFETIGSTLLIKASDNFNELELNLTPQAALPTSKTLVLKQLPTTGNAIIDKNITNLDSFLSSNVDELAQPSLNAVASFYRKFIEDITVAFQKTTANLATQKTTESSIKSLQSFMLTLIKLSEDFRKEHLQSIEEVFDKGINKMTNQRAAYLEKSPKTLKIEKGKKGKWRQLIQYYFTQKILPNTQKVLYDFGTQNFTILNTLSTAVSKESHLYLENFTTQSTDTLKQYINNINTLLEQLVVGISDLEKQTVSGLKSFERECCIEISKGLKDVNFFISIKKGQTLLSKKEQLAYKENVSHYAKDWHKNQVFAHKQAEAEWHLSNAGLSLAGVNTTIISHIDKSIITPLQLKIDSLTKAEKALYTKELNNQISTEIDEIAEGITHINFNTLLENEEERILDISPTVKRSVELLSPEAFNDFSNIQNDSLSSIDIALFNIQNYIIQTSYLDPLQNVLYTLENAFNINSEGIYNTANRIKHLIDINNTTTDLTGKENADNSSISHEIRTNIVESVTLLNKLFDSFKLDINSNLHHTTGNLDIRTIINSGELLSKAANMPVAEAKFKNWVLHKKEFIKQSYEHILHFVIQRQEDIDRLKFDEHHNQFTNTIELAHEFATTLSIHPKIKKALPFYYKKLFTGSHVANTSIIRKKELETARKAIARIDTGINGGILVIGKSQSGKSFLTEAISKIPANTDKYYINPPIKQNFTPTDMHQAFQKSFGKKGTALSIIKQVKKKSFFIFNDIERWWTRNEGGETTLNYLSELIAKQGQNHYFILNCNIYSYELIKQVSTIEQQLLATIITRPINKTELAEIILNRHKIGGAAIYYKEHLISKSSQVDSLFTHLHTISKGNIGAALNNWLTAIAINDEDLLEISLPTKSLFPTIDAKWKVLLYQFVLHKNLSEDQLAKLFKSEKDWVMQTLAAIQKSGLIENIATKTYSLKPTIRYFVEEKLKEANVL